ncbi:MULTISPECIES: NADPH-dependent FMN reductase [Streptomyces]|uniref:NADPH-dependent FMN reductase n=1 Tax=Streptomyces TaxID=1883 RepID=UPI00099E1C26|nr:MULTISPECIES: NAD(P)H-dependent oxidoreductase [Streptomyces]
MSSQPRTTVDERDARGRGDGRLKVAVIVASTREGRFAPTVADWFTKVAGERADLDVDVIDLADARLPDGLSRQPGPAVAEISPRLDAADAFVVITPEYNHSFPATLKTAIDWHYAEWRAKPVGFVSYGGMSGGLRAVEQLRQVFAELHAVTVRDTVSFHGVWDRFDASGEPVDPVGTAAAATTMLDQLAWWGHTLRDGKTVRPYAA